MGKKPALDLLLQKLLCPLMMTNYGGLYDNYLEIKQWEQFVKNTVRQTNRDTKTEIIIMIGSNKTIKNHVLSLKGLVYKITN